MKSRSFAVLVALVLLGGLMVSNASAATIAWNDAQWINDDSEVATTGTLVEAIGYIPTSGTVTVNGVAFTHFAGPLGTFDATGVLTGTFTNPPPGLSAAYKEFLGGMFYDGTQQTETLTLSGLTSGKTYLVQAWENYCPGGLAGLNETVDGVEVLVANSREDGTGPGQYIIGTFTADAATQAIVITPGPYAQLNGYQLREIPEPCTLALLAGGLVGLMAYAWRKRK